MVAAYEYEMETWKLFLKLKMVNPICPTNDNVKYYIKKN